MVKKLQALRAKKGFTLVELIVVIAIIGVLAAILVPTMMNVVTKARVSSSDQTAKSIADSVTNWIADLESNRGTVGEAAISVNVTKSGSSISVAVVVAPKDTFKRNGNAASAEAMLQSEFETNYPFKGGESAVIYVGADRHVKGVAYSDDGVTFKAEDKDGKGNSILASDFTAGTKEWKSASQEGIDSSSSKIIGTNPKLLYAKAAKP